MQSIPVTTRLKSLAKERAVGKETVPGATASQTDTTPGKTETKERISYQAAWDANAEGVRDKYKTKEDYVADRKSKKKENPEAYEQDLLSKTGVSGGPGTVTTTTPGSEKSVVTDLYRKNEQDVLTNFETRQNLRKGKFTNRRVKRAQNNVDDIQRKLDKLKASGVDSGKKFDRLTSKLTMRQENLKNTKNVKENASRSIDSGRRAGADAGRKVRQEDVLMTQGDNSRPQQLENAVTREANRTSNADKAVNPFDSIDISGSGDFSSNYTPFTGDLSGAINRARGLGERNTIKPAATKKKSGFQMKGFGIQ